MLRPLTDLLRAALLMIALVWAAGCSDPGSNNPVTSGTSGTRDSGDSGGRLMLTEVELYGRVATINPATRTMTLANNGTTIVVDIDAEVVQKDDGSETPITLDQIVVGDSAEVRGQLSGGTLAADRVRIRIGIPDEAEVETAGRVASIDYVNRVLSLNNDQRLFRAGLNAEIVLKVSGNETPIQFDEINIGDSVDVRGASQTDGSVLCDRIRVRIGFEDEFDADIEFKATIATINYAGGTFTVNGRSETISVDNLTYIFERVDNDDSSQVAAKRDGDDTDTRLRRQITFAELNVGDMVEVYANVLGNNQLYAVAIEREDPENNFDEVEFKALLTGIDFTASTLSFNNEWTATFDANTVVLDTTNNPITINQLIIGAPVQVSGVPTGVNTFLATLIKMEDSL